MTLEGVEYFRTGDIGYMDEDGFFYMVDRLKRMINAAGFKVWPAEVEALMHAHPEIGEACVIATKDARRGEAVKAVIVARNLDSPPKAQEIIQWCRANMALKAPTVIEFVESLPKSDRQSDVARPDRGRSCKRTSAKLIFNKRCGKTWGVPCTLTKSPFFYLKIAENNGTGSPRT